MISLPTEWSNALSTYGFTQRDLDQAIGKVLADAHRLQPHLDEDKWLAAFERVLPNQARAVIMGQDPYPDPDLATGVAFHNGGKRVSKSQETIRKVLEMRPGDLNQQCAPTFTGDLTPWMEQGMLLLNASYTYHGVAREDNTRVRTGIRIWKPLNTAVIEYISSKGIPVLLTGHHARMYEHVVHAPSKAFVTSHPVVQGARASRMREFAESDVFGQINDWLSGEGKPTIDWSLR